MACVCRRYNARSDWLIVTKIVGHYSPVMPAGRLRDCARAIGRKVITSAALALAFFALFLMCLIINNLITSIIRSLREILKLRPRRIERAIARSIR